MRRFSIIFLITCLGAGCAQQEPVISDNMLRVDDELPADFSGAWQRDYVRGDDPGTVLNKQLYSLSRTIPDSQFPGSPGAPGGYGLSPGKRDALIAIARLAEMITRPDTLTIRQNDNEISVERDEDFAIFCAFYNGESKATDTPYGSEICGWDDADLVSLLQLPDGLSVMHRFTVSEDGQQLRIITTVDSKTSPAPFSLSRFYRRYEPAESDFNCVETLSKKRVCSTGDLDL